MFPREPSGSQIELYRRDRRAAPYTMIFVQGDDGSDAIRTFEEPTQLMNAWAEAINRNEPRLLKDVFADEAQFVNLFGAIWQGREAIVDGHAWALGGVLRDSSMHFDGGTDLQQLGRDVVVIRGLCRRERAAHASPRTLEPGTTVLLLVARRDQDGWRAVAGANVAQQTH